MIAATIRQRATRHALRRSFATHLLQSGLNVRTVHELVEHLDLRTTMTYEDVLDPCGCEVRSPADAL